MEKLIYALNWDEPIAPDRIARALAALGVKGTRINLRDDAVRAGNGLIQSNGALLPDCIVQLWLSSSNTMFRHQLDAHFAAIATHLVGWLVCESTIIARPCEQDTVSQRTPGFAQIACLTLPDQMTWTDWRSIWRDSHTRIAIETQANFEYIQNLVVEPLTGTLLDEDSSIVAVVEECFPAEALDDPMAFFDAAGDPARFKANLDRMMESCGRFITPGTITVFPTSQYDFPG